MCDVEKIGTQICPYSVCTNYIYEYIIYEMEQSAVAQRMSHHNKGEFY